MEINKIEIEFKKDLSDREYAIITVNDDLVINAKGKLDKNKNNFGAIYAKKDKDGIERSILYRVALLINLIKLNKIEFEL